jgi:hypothetical protein
MCRLNVRPVFACALCCAAALVLAAAWSCRPDPAAAPTPRKDVSAADLVGRLRGLGLEAVPEAARGDPADGVFLCEGPRDAASLRGLMRLKGCAADWRGVVLMKRENHPDDVFYRQLDEWGENGLYEQPYVFFGDPQWVARIRAELEGDGRRADAVRPEDATAR